MVKKAGSEESMHLRTVMFLKQKYPDAIFFTDFAAGLFLPPWLAVKRKQLQSNSRGFPDIFVLSPQQGYHGLGLELKREGTRLKKKDGKWADDRLRRQNAVLERLDGLGYAAYFVTGLSEARAVIDWYFGNGPVFNTNGRIPLISKEPKVEETDAKEVF